jgi:diguanylate cyclase (GGDEF)-like protein/PAS domain S-box-containing protein
MLPPGDAATVRRYLDEAFAGRPTTIEYRSGATGDENTLDVVPLLDPATPPEVARDAGSRQPDEVLVVARGIGEIRRRDRDLAQAEARWRTTFGDSPVGMAELTLNGRILRANPALAELLGVPADTLQGQALLDLLHPPDDMPASSLVSGPVPGVRTQAPLERLVRRPDGALRWAKVHGSVVAGADGEPSHVLVHLTDSTAEREHKRAIGAARAYFAALVEHGSDVIVTVDGDLKVLYASPAYIRVFGVNPLLLEDERLSRRIHPDDQARVSTVFAALVDEPDAVRTLETRIIRADGEVRTIEVTATNRLTDVHVQGIVCNCRDVTDRVEATARLAHQAMHDNLTGLPNRALMVDRVAQALARAERSQMSCAVLFIDIDHFKRINDSLGHAAGDQVLVNVAKRLSNTLRPGDSAARFAGDEFVVLAEDIPTVEVVLRLAERIRGALTEPIRLPERTVTVDCSVGIALSKKHRPEALLEEADIALYRAKEEGRGRWELFDYGMRASVQGRLDTEELIRSAIDDDGLAVAYQPVIDLRTGRVSGNEALARIFHPDGTLVGPMDFIGVAEDSGLIVPLGSAVLGRACAQQAQWLSQGRRLEQVSVNISPRQLSAGTLVREVRDALEASGLQAEGLCLEFTESALIDAGNNTRRTIDELKTMGVMLAIDDFGTGWSSLAYLRQFPVDIVKIDRSFIAGLGSNDADTEVVRAVLGLGQALHLSTVAEGVETPGQEAMLKALGCDFAQGYRYGKPGFPEQLGLSAAE